MGTPLYWAGSDHEQAQPLIPAVQATKSPGVSGAKWSAFRRAYFFSPQQPELASDEQQEPSEEAPPQQEDWEQQEPQHFFQTS